MTLVDARGLKCPWPVLRLARAVRTGGPGHYRLVADDPAVPRDLQALAQERGWRVVAADRDEDDMPAWTIMAAAPAGTAG